MQFWSAKINDISVDYIIIFVYMYAYMSTRIKNKSETKLNTTHLTLKTRKHSGSQSHCESSIL